MSDALASLVAQHEIERCLIRFARAMDYRDWVALGELMCDDVTADFGTGLLNGREAIVGLIRQYLDACGPTQHLLGNILVDVAGDHAQSHAYVHDRHLPTGGATSPTYYTLGDYHDRWIKVDGRWLLLERMKDNRANVGPLSVFGLPD